jgi:hypothetical protein
MDAGFPEEKLLGKLEERGTPYVARVRNTAPLRPEGHFGELMDVLAPALSSGPDRGRCHRGVLGRAAVRFARLLSPGSLGA